MIGVLSPNSAPTAHCLKRSRALAYAAFLTIDLHLYGNEAVSASISREY